jgi:hypothetical protein
MLASGKVTGAEGERTLFPSGHRLPWRLVLALGAGPRRDFSEARFVGCVRRALEAARGLGARRLALALPGRDDERASAPAPAAAAAAPAAGGAALTSRRALDLLLQELDAAPGAVDELGVIAPAAVQKELGEVLRLRAVRAAAAGAGRPAAGPRHAPRPAPPPGAAAAAGPARRTARPKG